MLYLCTDNEHEPVVYDLVQLISEMDAVTFVELCSHNLELLLCIL